jgi:hypothetical protein
LRLVATARLEGHGLLEAPLRLEGAPYTISLLPSSGGTVAQIVIEKRIADYSDVLSRMHVRPGELPEIDLVAGGHPTDIISFLQHIESVGSLLLGITRIFWETTNFEWQGDSEEEEAQIDVKQFSSKYEYPPSNITITREHLYQTVVRREQQTHLVVPMAFFREGMREFVDQRHIYAFFNFYFFLEDQFGRGKTKNVQVVQEFLSSAELRRSAGMALARIEDLPDSRHRVDLTAFLVAEHLTWSVEDAIQLLVRMRGHLHHFSQRSSKIKGHPLNQPRFESLALFCMTICVDLLPRLLFPVQVAARVTPNER